MTEYRDLCIASSGFPLSACSYFIYQEYPAFITFYYVAMYTLFLLDVIIKWLVIWEGTLLMRRVIYNNLVQTRDLEALCTPWGCEKNPEVTITCTVRTVGVFAMALYWSPPDICCLIISLFGKGVGLVNSFGTGALYFGAGWNEYPLPTCARSPALACCLPACVSLQPIVATLHRAHLFLLALADCPTIGTVSLSHTHPICPRRPEHVINNGGDHYQWSTWLSSIPSSDFYLGTTSWISFSRPDGSGHLFTAIAGPLVGRGHIRRCLNAFVIEWWIWVAWTYWAQAIASPTRSKDKIAGRPCGYPKDHTSCRSWIEFLPTELPFQPAFIVMSLFAITLFPVYNVTMYRLVIPTFFMETPTGEDRLLLFLNSYHVGMVVVVFAMIGFAV